MSAVAGNPPIAPGRENHTPTAPHKQGMSQGRKIGYSVLGVWLGGIVLFIILFGFKSHKAPAVASGVFSPTERVQTRHLVQASGRSPSTRACSICCSTVGITLGVMLYVAKRLQQRPGRLQVAVEAFYDFTRRMSKENLDADMERKYFPLIATIFVFILVSNLIGYIPLPVDSGETLQRLRRAHPLAADLRGRHQRRVPAGPRAERVRALHLRGSQAPRADRLPQKPDAGRRQRPDRAADLRHRDPLELPAPGLADGATLGEPARRALADRVHGRRARSARRAPGASPGSCCRSGIAIFLFEAVLIAGLQAFIFSILTAIYLGSAVSSH